MSDNLITLAQAKLMKEMSEDDRNDVFLAHSHAEWGWHCIMTPAAFEHIFGTWHVRKEMESQGMVFSVIAADMPMPFRR